MADEPAAPIATTPLATSRVLLGLLIWLALALLLGKSGLPKNIRPPGPQLMIVALSAVFTAAALKIPRLSAWFFTVDERLILSFHLTRFVGFYFIILYLADELPYELAVVGGFGDIVVAIIALSLMTMSRLKPGPDVLSYILWNVVGLLEILYVVYTAARIGSENPYALWPMQVLPLFLLPSFVVPIIIGTHILFGLRLQRMSAKRIVPAV